jgi:DNA-binding GntR family transcriptional regulator
MASETGKMPSDDLSRADYAYSRLMEMIRSGALRPGQRLREIELSERLGVSRTPVREALRRIGAEGLAQNSSSRGFVITEYDKQQVRELYALRAVLEGAAAGFAARHASSSEIELMREILQRSVAALEVPEEMMRMNLRFHQAIHDAAHNRYLKQALSQMSDALALLPGTTYAAPNRALEAHGEHLAILEALERGAPEEAEALTRRHIELAGATRLRLMFGMEA